MTNPPLVLRSRDDQQPWFAVRRRADGGSTVSVAPSVAAHPSFNDLLKAWWQRRTARTEAALRRLINTALVAHWPPTNAPEASAEIRLRGQLAARGVRMRCNDNRRLLASVRRETLGVVCLSIHRGLLDHPSCHQDLVSLATSRQRSPLPDLEAAMATVFAGIEAEQPQATAPDTADPIGLTIDLDEHLDAIMQQWFPALPRPTIGWSRSIDPTRTLRSIRFGSYRRDPAPEIRIHPRLAQPWISLCFLRHVIHHECCHHAQACDPITGERMHSARFRAWERAFDDYAAAREWERRHLGLILAPAVVDSLDHGA